MNNFIKNNVTLFAVTLAILTGAVGFMLLSPAIAGAYYDDTVWYGDSGYDDTVWYGDSGYNDTAWYGDSGYDDTVWYGNSGYDDTVWYGDDNSYCDDCGYTPPSYNYPNYSYPTSNCGSSCGSTYKPPVYQP